MNHPNKKVWKTAVVGGILIFSIAVFIKVNKISVVNFFDLGIVGVVSSFLLSILVDQHTENQELIRRNENRLRTIEGILHYFKEAELSFKSQSLKISDAIETTEEKTLELQITLEQHIKNAEKMEQDLGEVKKTLVSLLIFVEALKMGK